jgi:hypothetical protein
VPRIDLFIDDIHAGINGFGEFVLTVKGRLDTREFGPLNHASAKEHLDHWIGNQSAQHIDAALNAASDSIADQLIRAVFVQNESPR